jgi:hypothetical protein
MVCVRRSTQVYKSLLFRLGIGHEMITNFNSDTTKTPLSFSITVATDSAQHTRLACSEKTQKCHLDR